MSYFKADITRLRQQAETLREKARRLSNIHDELKNCTARLRELDCIDLQLHALDIMDKRRGAEYSSMLALARGLESAVELYVENERRCENDSAGRYSVSTNHTGTQSEAVPQILSRWQRPVFWKAPYPWRGSLTQSVPARLGGIGVCAMLMDNPLRGKVHIEAGDNISEGEQ